MPGVKAYWRSLAMAAGAALIGTLVLGAYAVHRLGGPRYTAHRLYTISAWPAYTQRESQLDVLPKPTASSVVLLGDSHVAYGQWDELLPGCRVSNRGVPGEGIDGVASNFERLVPSPPLALVLQVGTNDLLFHDPQEALRRYEALLQGALGKYHDRLYVCTLPGVSNEVRWTGIEADDVAQLNAGLLALATRLGVQVLDLGAALGSVEGRLPSSLSDDGVHLRGSGYLAWAKLLAEHLPCGTTFDPSARAN